MGLQNGPRWSLLNFLSRTLNHKSYQKSVRSRINLLGHSISNRPLFDPELSHLFFSNFVDYLPRSRNLKSLFTYPVPTFVEEKKSLSFHPSEKLSYLKLCVSGYRKDKKCTIWSSNLLSVYFHYHASYTSLSQLRLIISVSEILL